LTEKRVEGKRLSIGTGRREYQSGWAAVRRLREKLGRKPSNMFSLDAPTVRLQSLALAALSATLTVSTGAFPGPGPAKRTASRAGALGPAAMHFGRSVGSPTDGHLVGGSHLEESAYLRVVPSYDGGDVRWGLASLVSMIDRAARQVRRQFP